MATPPSRNDRVTRDCPVCGRTFVAIGRQRVCSAACRQAVWRRRHPRAPRAATIYACPACDARYLGEQRCPECGVFCRRVGPGGPCPHCDEPVALADLLPLLKGGDATIG